MALKELISVARGDTPADLLLKNARIVNTFTGEVEEGDVAIYQERIAGIGDYQGSQVTDLKGSYLAPGLIDGHTHIESSMLHPAEYARAVVPRGTLALVTDLHEIANVAGLKGMRQIMAWARRLPLDIFFMMPSCVPATHLETSGASIEAEDILKGLSWEDVLGLGEMMNFPGVIGGEGKVLTKLLFSWGRVKDGHAPGVKDKQLNAYIAAGIFSDHESTTLEEAEEKLKRGMYIMIREGSSAKNLETLLPLVTDQTYKRCFFAVDDRSPTDLVHEGDMDDIVRKAIKKGLAPIRAIQLATINPAEYFGLAGLGAIAPGYFANLIVVDNLSSFRVGMVFYQGEMIAKDGKLLYSISRPRSSWLSHTVKVKPFTAEALKLPAKGDTYPVIEVTPGQIVTRKKVEKVKIEAGTIVSDIDSDILKLVVVERHRATGNMGIGLVKGFGLKKGALASSVAHDSHNIVVVGANDTDIFMAIKEVERLQGGLVVCADGSVVAALPLPIAGLLSDKPLETVVDKSRKVEEAAASLGNVPPSPFAILSFLALPVIPELKLTDLGLVDVLEFRIAG